MKTTKEKIEIMQVYENGADIEFRKKSKVDNQWITLYSYSSVVWDWLGTDYRTKPEPKKRLMTIKELWGKTLVSRNGCLVTVNKVDSHNQINMLDSWITVEEAHLNDWRLAGSDLDYETATSLEVEE